LKEFLRYVGGGPEIRTLLTFARLAKKPGQCFSVTNQPGQQQQLRLRPKSSSESMQKKLAMKFHMIGTLAGAITPPDAERKDTDFTPEEERYKEANAHCGEQTHSHQYMKNIYPMQFEGVLGSTSGPHHFVDVVAKLGYARYQVLFLQDPILVAVIFVK
jgi:hypothetical protein